MSNGLDLNSCDPQSLGAGITGKIPALLNYFFLFPNWDCGSGSVGKVFANNCEDLRSIPSAQVNAVWVQRPACNSRTLGAKTGDPWGKQPKLNGELWVQVRGPASICRMESD